MCIRINIYIHIPNHQRHSCARKFYTHYVCGCIRIYTHVQKHTYDTYSNTQNCNTQNCNTLGCDTLQHTRLQRTKRKRAKSSCCTRPRTAVYIHGLCNKIHTETRTNCNALSATHCNLLQHTRWKKQLLHLPVRHGINTWHIQ